MTAFWKSGIQDINGNRSPLPKTNIDTGMGLERITAVMQGKRTFYDTDVFEVLIKTVSDLSGHKYGHDERTDRAIRIVAEHCRSVAFLIGDGVLPSNEGRGYVLRRVLRRAALFGKTLDMESPFIAKIADVAINGMSAFYADLNEHKQVILNVINTEEEKFSQTLNTGLSIIENIMEELKKKGENIIPGKEVFRLYDTYGFPRELTAEVAAENGLITDSKGFEDEMERQRQRARASQKTISKEKAVVSYTLLPPTDFMGYRQLKVDARIMSLAVDGHIEERMSRGQQVEVILDKTPFYAEMGGQVTDTGTITGRTGSILITYVKRDKADHFIHYGEVTNGEVTNGDLIVAEVDVERRLDIARNHTATHLLQAALRKILGMHVQQMGSLVDPDRLRFDFSHNSAISRENLLKVQELVNKLTRSNLQVIAKENISIDRAKAEGATALFGEKYGDIVRVIEIRKPADPVVSMELCGGTHLEATGQIGFFYILNESGIGSGIRRIEAVTGRVAEKIFEERVQSLESAAKLFGTSVNEVDSKLKSVIEEINAQKKLIAELEHAKMLESVSKEVSDLVKTKRMLNGVAIITGHVSASNIEVLRQVGDLVKQQMDSGVIVLGAIWDDKPNFLAMVSADLTKKGLHAGQIVKQVAQVTGGSGGGRPELGQAGGKDKSKMEEALKMVETLVNKS
ncbi:MAG: alanine--tRNA ligase [Chloroflexi bacterium]|nr:alanine--tRNA ligase [Chloroflexota bacterium]